jgi:hypothetical protein
MTSGSGERRALGARGEEQGSVIADALFGDHTGMMLVSNSLRTLPRATYDRLPLAQIFACGAMSI